MRQEVSYVNETVITIIVGSIYRIGGAHLEPSAESEAYHRGGGGRRSPKCHGGWIVPLSRTGVYDMFRAFFTIIIRVSPRLSSSSFHCTPCLLHNTPYSFAPHFLVHWFERKRQSSHLHYYREKTNISRFSRIGMLIWKSPLSR